MTTTPSAHGPAPRPDAGAFTIRSVEDVLALVVYGLGFHPQHSLVLVALTRSGGSFQARVDLPTALVDIPLASAPLAEAAIRNGSQAAFVLAYSEDDLAAHLAADSLDEALAASGIEVIGVLQVKDGGYADLTEPGSPPSAGLRSVDLSGHPLLLQAAFDGRAPHETRESLAASVRAGDGQADRELVARIDAECRRRHDKFDRSRSHLAFEADWVRRATRRALGRGTSRGRAPGEPVLTVLTVQEIARLLVALTDSDVRDVVWVGITRDEAAAQVELWTRIVRLAPDAYVVAPAALLAFAAWLSGNGSLAWCAVDRCREIDASYSLALLVAGALESAVPPSEWAPVDPRTLPLLADPLEASGAAAASRSAARRS